MDFWFVDSWLCACIPHYAHTHTHACHSSSSLSSSSSPSFSSKISGDYYIVWLVTFQFYCHCHLIHPNMYHRYWMRVHAKGALCVHEKENAIKTKASGFPSTKYSNKIYKISCISINKFSLVSKTGLLLFFSFNFVIYIFFLVHSH